VSENCNKNVIAPVWSSRWIRQCVGMYSRRRLVVVDDVEEVCLRWEGPSPPRRSLSLPQSVVRSSSAASRWSTVPRAQHRSLQLHPWVVVVRVSGGYDCDSTAIGRRYDRSTTYVTAGLNEQIGQPDAANGSCQCDVSGLW